MFHRKIAETVSGSFPACIYRTLSTLTVMLLFPSFVMFYSRNIHIASSPHPLLMSRCLGLVDVRYTKLFTYML